MSYLLYSNTKAQHLNRMHWYDITCLPKKKKMSKPIYLVKHLAFIKRKYHMEAKENLSSHLFEGSVVNRDNVYAVTL